MVGALTVGERRLMALIDRYGTDTIRDGSRSLIDYSERRLRAEIAELPDGEYSAAMWVEDDGVTTDPFEVKVAIVIRGDEIIADFTGSSAQVKGPMNAVYVVAASAVYNAVFCVTDPMTLIPRNSGCYRPIRIVAPPGSVVNCEHPAPSVGGNTDLQPKLIDLLLEALAPAAPAMVAASTGGSSSNLLFGGVNPETGQFYSNYHYDGMGTGATLSKDGNDAETTRHSNCRNTPIEVFEQRYPLLTIDHGLVQDSGGPGRHRGGLATFRTLRVMADEVTFSALFDRCKILPHGLAGGMDAKGSEILVRRAGELEFRRFDEVFGVASPTKFTNVVLKRGDELYYQTAGGGGHGPPTERDPESVLADVRDGYVSGAAALRDYQISSDLLDGL